MTRYIFLNLLLFFLVTFFYPIFIYASPTDGTIDGNFKYAWSNMSGWVNFGLSSGNIHITDAALTGYAWLTNHGWMNLNPSNGGLSNDGEGNLSGSAWIAGLGWIDFANVKINDSGKFTGFASSSAAGAITFDCANCDVRTDWRPVSVRNGGGGGEGGGGGGGGGGEGIFFFTTTFLPEQKEQILVPTTVATPTSVPAGTAAGTAIAVASIAPSKEALPQTLFDINIQPTPQEHKKPTLLLAFMIGLLTILVYAIYSRRLQKKIKEVNRIIDLP